MNLPERLRQLARRFHQFGARRPELWHVLVEAGLESRRGGLHPATSYAFYGLKVVRQIPRDGGPFEHVFHGLPDATEAAKRAFDEFYTLALS
jgi:hypothetical protein